MQLHLFEIDLFNLLFLGKMDFVDQSVQLLVVLVMLLRQPSEVFIRLQEVFLDVYSPHFQRPPSLSIAERILWFSSRLWKKPNTSDRPLTRTNSLPQGAPVTEQVERPQRVANSHQSFKSSFGRRECDRLTGISVSRLSAIFNCNVRLNQGTTSLILLRFTKKERCTRQKISGSRFACSSSRVRKFVSPDNSAVERCTTLSETLAKTISSESISRLRCLSLRSSFDFFCAAGAIKLMRFFSWLRLPVSDSNCFMALCTAFSSRDFSMGLRM